MSNLFMCHASDLFAGGSGKIPNDFGLTREDVAFFEEDVQLFTPALWRCANRVEALFRASKSGHEGVGAVISRVKNDCSHAIV